MLAKAELKRILIQLNEANIKYCVLRNYEYLYNDEPIESLDTSVSREDFPTLHHLLKKEGFQTRKPQFSLKHKSYFKIINGQLISFDIQVAGVYWNDMKYLSEDIFARRVRHKFFYVLHHLDYYLMLVCHSVLGKRYFKPKYQEILSSLPVGGEAIDSLTRIFSKKLAQKLYIKVSEGRFNHVKCQKYAVYFILKDVRHLFTFISLSWRWIKWKKFLQPQPLISIIGPDGAGKSSAVEALQEYLETQKRKCSVVYTGRGRSHFLPITKLGKKYKSQEKAKDGSGSQLKPRTSLKRRLLYTLAAPVFTLDLLLRYYLRILPKRFKGIVVTDRYCSDIILMNHVPFSFRKILYGLFPKPTTTVLLHHDVKVLMHRRPEESPFGLQRQLIIFKKFKYDLVLKTTTPSTTRQVLDFIYAQLLRDWR